MSCLNRCLNGEGCFDRCENVDVGTRCPDGHDQSVSRQRIEALQVGFFLPPPANGEHADRLALGQIGSASRPEIRMERSAVAEGAEQPVFATPTRRALFFVPSGLIDAGATFVYAFVRVLHPQAQSVRRVAMAARPTAFAGIGLDEI